MQNLKDRDEIYLYWKLYGLCLSARLTGLWLPAGKQSIWIAEEENDCQNPVLYKHWLLSDDSLDFCQLKSHGDNFTLSILVD